MEFSSSSHKGSVWDSLILLKLKKIVDNLNANTASDQHVHENHWHFPFSTLTAFDRRRGRRRWECMKAVDDLIMGEKKNK